MYYFVTYFVLLIVAVILYLQLEGICESMRGTQRQRLAFPKLITGNCTFFLEMQ